MRLLLVSFAPLTQEYGAAQIALNLASALRERGHEVVLWAPGTPPAGTPWWRQFAWKRRELERFVASQPAFDVIDAPPPAVTRRVARGAAVVIARSVQPELQYLACDLMEQARGLLRHPLRFGASALHAGYLAGLVLAGWHRADLVLCLGSHEERWMRRRFFWLRSRLAHYVVAPSPADQERLRQVRERRQANPGPGTRFLWIGRWAAHKGTRRLLRFIRKRARAHPHDSFTIAGYGVGAERDVPVELVAADRVRLVPSFTREQLFDLLASHDAGLFTSVVEGWGLTLNEMLESGMPVYATEAGGVVDLRRVCQSSLAQVSGTVSCKSAALLAAHGPEYERVFRWDAIAAAYCGQAGLRAAAALDGAVSARDGGPAPFASACHLGHEHGRQQGERG